MHIVHILLYIAAGYLAMGIATTMFLSQTPYADNAWWITTLLWPVFLWAVLF